MESREDRVEWRLGLLAKALRRLRLDRGLTLTELGDAISSPGRRIGPEQPSRWETGDKVPSGRSLFRILDALDASFVELEMVLRQVAAERGEDPDSVLPGSSNEGAKPTLRVQGTVELELETILEALQRDPDRLRDLARVTRAAAQAASRSAIAEDEPEES